MNHDDLATKKFTWLEYCVAKLRILPNRGNLTMICSTLGTPYALDPAGTVLFIEDVHEAPYRVDRSLSQLKLAGMLT